MSYILSPVSRNKRNQYFFSMQFLIPPAGGALFSLWTATFLFWMSHFVIPSCHWGQMSEPCAACHTLTLKPRNRALCHGRFERKSNSTQHSLGIKGVALPSNPEKSWCFPSHAFYMCETRLNIQVLMTDSKI